MSSLHGAALKAQLAAVFQTFPEVEAAFLFGSEAEGRARADSDLDVAVLLACEDAELTLRLLEALAAAGLDRVDLVVLNQADPVTRFEAVRANKLLFARQGFDRGEFYSRIVREYLDLLPILEPQRHALRHRLARA